jgi:hypothetical protein
MNTPFDRVIEQIKLAHFHNHRRPIHSDEVSIGILEDLKATCLTIAQDFEKKVIHRWLNVRTPGARQRKIDLLIGEPAANGKPDLTKLRICVENKSVVTAHRNADTRFDDLNEALQVLHRAQSEAILVATVMIGVAPRFLNIPDVIKKNYRKKMSQFEKKVVPRLSSGDQTLWDKFDYAISPNRATDSKKTVEKFRQLPTRHIGHTHVVGYDFVLLVPVDIDNVNPPSVARANTLGIDVDSDYRRMLDQVCKAYNVRWHS